MNSSLRRRMLLAYLLGAALLAAGAVLTLVGANRVVAMYAGDVGNLQEARADMLALATAFRIQSQEWQNVLLRGHDAGLRDRHWQAFQKQGKAVQEMTSRLLGRLPAGDARRLLKSFGDAHRQMGATYRRGFDTFRAGGFDPRLGDQVVAGSERLPAEMLEQAVEASAKTVADYRRQAANAADSARQLAIVLLVVLALGGAAVFAIKTHYDILVPLRDLMDQVARLARGELAEPVTSFTDGELRELAASVEELREHVIELLDKARRSSNTLALSSIELKAAAETVVRNMDAGNQSLSSLATATDRMIVTMRTVGEKSLAIQNIAINAAAKTRAGNATLRDLAQGLEHVDRLLGDISKSVSGFAAGTRGIKGMTRKVQEIADRTQLLAVNASIEAAQAGERGYAFAAVAEEVRALAHNTACTAQEIAALSQRLNAFSGAVESVLQRGRVRLMASLAESQAADRMLLQALEAVTAAADGVAAVVDSIRQQELGLQQASSMTLDLASEKEQNSVSLSRIRQVVDQLRRCAVDNHRRAVAVAQQ